MFQEWGFLLTEIWVLLVLAALIGLIAGWLIFGNQAATAGAGDADRLQAENAQLRSQLAAAEAPAVETASAAPTMTGTVPEQLDAPRDGKADDLKRISGVGPRMEQMCNMLGFWHYDQIANWTESEIAWVDENLQGFKGRLTRDDWVSQAKILAEGGETEFSKQQDAKS
ncbi:MAG: hypothetical protein AAFQ64_17895 [Pseudomonadota bacterium]